MHKKLNSYLTSLEEARRPPARRVSFEVSHLHPSFSPPPQLFPQLSPPLSAFPALTLHYRLVQDQDWVQA